MTTYEPADVARAVTIEARGYRIDEAIIAEAVRKMGVLVVDPASTVVLDPDNPDEVVRLRDAIGWSHDMSLPRCERALRSLLPVVTPPEPNGLGAVVEWQGQRWLRAYLKHDLPWLNGSVTPSRARWNEFGKVVVLSHGVGCSCGAPDCDGGAQ